MKRKIISVILVVMIIACTPISVFVTSADTESDYKQQLSDLQEKEEKYQEQLDKTNKDIEDKEEYSEALVSQIEVLSTEISTYHQQISDLNTSISKKQKAIKKSKKKIEKQMDSLKYRIRSIYMAGETSDLDIILGAKDFSDFLDKYDMIERLSAVDEELIDEIEVELDAITEEKEELVAQRSELKSAESELSKKQKKLTKLLNKNEEVLESLYEDQSDAESMIENYDAQESEVQEQLSAYYKKLKKSSKSTSSSSSTSSSNTTSNSSSSSSSSSGSGSSSSITVSASGFAWPVPGYYYVISGFNEDRGYSHKGIDISGSGIMGATVVAAASGTVIASNNTCTHNWGKSGSCGCGGGYGNYVLIDHGNGKSTLYGHLSSASVSTGDTVKKGQTIGYVGSTGWSTGAHLHFETRLDGTAYNPMNEY